MLLLAVLSVVFMLGLGFVAILYALADIEGRGNVPRLNIQPSISLMTVKPVMQGATVVGHI